MFSSGNIDLISFSMSLASLDIEMDNLVTYPSNYSIPVKGVLTVGDLRRRGINVSNKNDDVVLLDTIEEEINLVLICNKVSGYMSSEDNKNTLMSLGNSISNFKVISARALDLKIGFNVKTNLNSDEVSLFIESSEENSLVRDCLMSIEGILGSIRQKVS